MKKHISLEFKEEIPAPDDFSLLVLHYTGGLCARLLANGWSLEPVPVDNVPNIIGFFSHEELPLVIENIGAVPVFYEQQGVSDGIHHRFFRPWSPRALNKQQSAGDLWSNIARNLQKSTAREKELARHISLSIQSVEVHVGRISGFYNSQLVAAIRSRKTPRARFQNSLDKEISASLHDFYAALGTARDHLAALIALRLGKPKQTDDFSKLLRSVEGERMFLDPMMGLLASRKDITLHGKKWRDQGILQEIRELRRRLVHREPYGSYEDELWGRIVEARGGENMPIYLYEQCLLDDKGNKFELLKMVRRHYLFSMKLFEEMANCSGYGSAMRVFTEEDISSFEIRTR